MNLARRLRGRIGVDTGTRAPEPGIEADGALPQRRAPTQYTPRQGERDRGGTIE
jgi:hypothetical protein